MKILFLSQLVPYPPDAGPKVRSYHVLEYLAAAGHEITLLAFCRSSDGAAQIDALRALCADVRTIPITRSRLKDAWQLTRSLLSGQPFLIVRDWSSDFLKVLRELIETNCGDPAAHFDAVHADQLWMAPYALATRESCPGARLVLDQHNAVFEVPARLAQHESDPAKRLLFELEARKMARYEAHICRLFDRVVWVTAEDRVAVMRHSGNAGPLRSSVIPIGVDVRGKPLVSRSPNAHRVTFLGGLHWPPNAQGLQWFADEVWPAIHEYAPQAILTVIGRTPPRALTRLAARSGTGVEVTGYVPDPLGYLAETAAFVVPLHAGGGMRVKILDAWSWGLPIVSTRLGAEGLAYRPGDNLLIADGAPAFAASVLRLLGDPALAATLVAGGRRTVEERYDWQRIYCAWDEVYAN